ncbi:MAG: phosphoribosylglycinamide formyltransferase [Gammaproteobacteria bacterium]
MPCVILISGRGTNLQAILRAVAEDGLPLEIRAVISNRPEAAGLDVARSNGLPHYALDHAQFTDREAFDRELQNLIDRHASVVPGVLPLATLVRPCTSVAPGVLPLATLVRPCTSQLVILAGFMRILSGPFVRHYRGRLINIHPSLLPAFPGLNTHQRALDAGVTVHGATVHFVTEAVDGGPVIIQARVPVLPQDTTETLAARVLAEEHRIYPQALRWFAEGRLHLVTQQNNDVVVLDGKPLGPSGCQTEDNPHGTLLA